MIRKEIKKQKSKRKLRRTLKRILLKYKHLLQDIYLTKAYRWLKNKYIPKVIKPDLDENGQLIEKNGMISGQVTLAQALLEPEEFARI